MENLSDYYQGPKECTNGMLPPHEVTGLIPGLIILHFVTLVNLLAHAKVVYDRVELSHPVFAVIFQEMVFLSLCELVNFLMLLDIAYAPSETIFVASLFIARLAMQFHPIAWFVVTLLRYYLLVIQPCPHQDLKPLKRRSLLLVWSLFLPFVVLMQGMAFLILTGQGWPNVPMKSFGSRTGFWIATSAIFLSNLPDIASVIIYFWIWKHFKLRIHVNLPQEKEMPYGGIWVGESFDMGEQPFRDSTNIEAQHKVESVFKALGWHLKLCLFDLALPLLTLFKCNEVAAYFLYPLQVVCFYWVPFLVIKNGFQEQLDEVVNHIWISIKSTVRV